MDVLTMADLLDQLGDIPPQRVRLRPAPGTATEQDVIDIHDRENRLFELVDGVLVEKVMGFFESRVAAVLIQLLGNFTDLHNLGIVLAPDGMMRIAPHLVRMPDVSFVSWNRLPGHQVPRAPIPDLAPDLAIEVLSEGNTQKEMARKVREYFDAGVRLVWLVDPETRTAGVFTSPESRLATNEEQMLAGGDVLPGFALRLGELLDRASGTHGRA